MQAFYHFPESAEDSVLKESKKVKTKNSAAKKGNYKFLDASVSRVNWFFFAINNGLTFSFSFFSYQCIF